MSESEDTRTYVEHLRNEHVHIDHALQELQHIFSQTAESREADPVPLLLAKLKGLREELRKHFRQEEEGGAHRVVQDRGAGHRRGGARRGPRAPASPPGPDRPGRVRRRAG